ncbi:MAG TPA: hypothetical protein PKZ92_03880 [Candidatus Woesebacteria bacterium]|jgi:hypothetical protein|nr:hypothetical protein [Candidatus Shapirobacteria bacterium]HOR02367.1 hypothetical protein [Candidatus Woesebacteria bacterium]
MVNPEKSEAIRESLRKRGFGVSEEGMKIISNRDETGEEIKKPVKRGITQERYAVGTDKGITKGSFMSEMARLELRTLTNEGREGRLMEEKFLVDNEVAG